MATWDEVRGMALGDEPSDSVDIPSLDIAKVLLRGVDGNVRKYTSDSSVVCLLDGIEAALEAGNRTETVFLCRQLEKWYKRNILAIMNNSFTTNKETHARNVNLVGNLADAMEDNPQWFDSSSNCLSGENGTTVVSQLDSKKNKMVFISHSSKDSEIIGRLVELLRSIGLDNSNLFCSSHPAFGVPLGENILEFLKRCFTDYELYVILAISKENYYKSPVSLNEMGAAWVVARQSVLLLLPGTAPSDLSGVIGSESLAMVLDSEEAKYRLNELKDSVIGFLGLPEPNANVWEINRDEFLNVC